MVLFEILVAGGAARVELTRYHFIGVATVFRARFQR
jgi:hypothetical protein